MPNSPAQPNDQGTLVGPVVPTVGGSFTVIFDDLPPGHWGIVLPDGVDKMAARMAVSNYARGNRGGGNVANGSQTNCR